MSFDTSFELAVCQQAKEIAVPPRFLKDLIEERDRLLEEKAELLSVVDAAAAPGAPDTETRGRRIALVKRLAR